ncbi:MAG: hypothetical protein MK213_07135, partial [Planctomycetes bacterium]|nr:hypothetical protein [Planctomycetota bacterium]
MGAPTQPATGYPFMDNFETRVAHSEAEIPTLGPRLRLLKRDASPQLGAWFLSSGRSRFALDGPQESWLSRAASMGMALSGLDQPRTLLTGLVHPALMNSIANPPALMNSSANHPSEFILAPLPMESADLIARAPGGTLADTLAKTSLQKASTEPFDLVFSYQPWHWSEKSSVFQECRIAMLAQSVRDGGVLVQAFDSGAINRAGIDAMLNSLKRMGLHSELLIVPNDWQRPGILLVSWESRPMLTRTALVRLKAHQWLGLPQDSKLLVLPRSQSSAHSLSSLLGPVTPTVRTFAEFEPRTIHELSSERRAADFLRTFLPGPSENEPPSFLGVLVAHLDAQVYHVNDTLPGVPVTEQLDLDEATVEALSNLTVAHGGTRFIRDLWTGMTHLLVEKRELNWIFNWLQPLANESDQAPLWNHPATLWAIGDAYQEIYEHDS